MSEQHYQIATQKFIGDRFKDHGLDLDVLPELIAYKTLLIETAKTLWRQKNPDRQRLKRNFEDELKLKFYELGKGSVTVPIHRTFKVEEDTLDFGRQSDELDEAVELLNEAMQAASQDKVLPNKLPKSIVPLFKELGKTLREDEVIEFASVQSASIVTYTKIVQEHLLTRIVGEYTDQINIQGEVRLAAIDGNRFTIRQDDGTKVDGHFETEQETFITEALREHASCRIEIQGTGSFDANGALKGIDHIEKIMIRRVGEQIYDSKARPIWEVVEEIGQSILEEEWNKLPKDASMNLDRYLYGKENQDT